MAYDRLVATSEAIEAIRALSGMRLPYDGASRVCDEEKWHQ